MLGQFVMCTQLLSRVWFFVTLWTKACQAPLSMWFFMQEYWSELSFPPPGDFPNPGIKDASPALQVDSLPAESSVRRRQWQPTPVLLPGKSLGWRSLVGCSPWGRYKSDMTERLHFHFSLSCIGERNGNPLQCSCLENPRDGGAWWAAIYGVTQSQTWLQWLSSSSSSRESDLTTLFKTAILASPHISETIVLLHIFHCSMYSLPNNTFLNFIYCI